jgi:hypothetical protein
MKCVNKLKRLIEEQRRRRVRWDGVIEEYCPLMGRIYTIPFIPKHPNVDLSPESPGWEPWQNFRNRLHRNG